jgi:cation diffusion facilitator CzcD-associated flavoprotein CzcO
LIKAQRVFMCVNRRLGTVRRVVYPGESSFKGQIVYGVEDDAKSVDWENKKVLILGAGAFATENARTALECGA